MSALGTLLKVLAVGAATIECVATVKNAMKTGTEESPVCTNDKYVYSHGDAIAAVYEYITYDSTKSRALELIPVGAPADFYYAVITALKNTHYDCEKVEAIRKLKRAYGL